MTLSRIRRMILLLAVVAIVAAACGDSSDEGAPVAPTVADVGDGEPAVLPPNPDADSPPPAAGACLVGEPDCNDTMLPGEEPTDLPLPSDEPAGPSGMLVDGGLSVSQALEGNASGVIAVTGFLIVAGDQARLCELLAESYPPQCGGASLPVTGYEEVLGVPLTTAQDVSWTEGMVSFLGEIVDGTLVVDATVAQ